MSDDGMTDALNFSPGYNKTSVSVATAINGHPFQLLSVQAKLSVFASSKSLWLSFESIHELLYNIYIYI